MEFVKTIETWQDEKVPEESRRLSRRSVTLRPETALPFLANEKHRKIILRFFKERERITNPQKLIESQAIMDSFSKNDELIDNIIEKEHDNVLHHFLKSIIVFLRESLMLNQRELYLVERTRAKEIQSKLMDYHMSKESLEKCPDCFNYQQFLNEILESSPWDELVPTRYLEYQERLTEFSKLMFSTTAGKLMKDYSKLFTEINNIRSIESRKKLFSENFIQIYSSLINLVPEDQQGRIAKDFIKFIDHTVAVNPVVVDVKNIVQIEVAGKEKDSIVVPNNGKTSGNQTYRYMMITDNDNFIENAIRFLLNINSKYFSKSVSGKITRKYLTCLSNIVQANFTNQKFREKFERGITDKLLTIMDVVANTEISITTLEVIAKMVNTIAQNSIEGENVGKIHTFWGSLTQKNPVQAKMAEAFAHLPLSPIKIDCRIFPVVDHTVLAGQYDRRLFYFSQDDIESSKFIIRFKVDIEEFDIRVGIFFSNNNFKVSEKQLIHSQETTNTTILPMTKVSKGGSLSGALLIESPCLVYFVFDNSYSIFNEKKFCSKIHVLKSC